MGQEYSGADIASVSYPEAVGYIRKKHGKKNKYNLSKVEIASFSKIPYSKYVPLDERNTSSYKRSLHSHSPTRQPMGRDCNSAPGARNTKTINQGKTANVAMRDKNPVEKYTGNSAASSNGIQDTSILSNSSMVNSSLNTSAHSTNKKSGQSTNTSLLSVKESPKKKGKSGSKEQKTKFIPRSDKEIQLSKIYIKPQDLVLEKPKKKKKSSKSQEKKEKKTNKQKALFRIRKKTKVEPTPVYLESPFKRQTTIRIKKSQVAPSTNRNQPSVQNQRTVSRESQSRFSVRSAKTVTHRSRSPVKENTTRVPRKSRSPDKSFALELDIVGTKSQLFVRDTNSKPKTPDPEALFVKRNRSRSPEKAKIYRPGSAAEVTQTFSPTKPRANKRPQSSPYKTAPYLSEGTPIYPGYRGKDTKNGRTSLKTASSKKNKRTAVAPMSTKVANKNKIKIVKGKKSDSKSTKEPKVRLKWFNVLHRSHYQNRIDSLYNKEHSIGDYVTDNEQSIQDQTGEDNDWRTECGSLNTYSDSFLTNTTLSTANATVLGELDRNSTEVDCDPSVYSDITIVNSDTSTLVNEYEGDGETDLDKPLRFKHKKTPQLLRKDLSKMKESYFRNHPGVEIETDTDTDVSTITDDFPSEGHVDKMRRLFGVIDGNQTPKARQPTTAITRIPQREKEEPYQPTFINKKNPAHLFQVGGKENKHDSVTEKSSMTKAKNVVVKDGKNNLTNGANKNSESVKAPLRSAKSPVVVVPTKKVKSPTFLTEFNALTKVTNKKSQTETKMNGRSTLYSAQQHKKDLPVFLQPKSDTKNKLRSPVAETKPSIIDMIAKEEEEDLIQPEEVASDSDDSLQGLDDAAAMAKQQQNVRHVMVKEVQYNGDINSALAELWDKQHDGDSKTPNEQAPKSPKPMPKPIVINGTDKTVVKNISAPGGGNQTPVIKTLNPVQTYRRNQETQPNNTKENTTNLEIPRSSDFNAKRDFFEAKEPQMTSATRLPHGETLPEPLLANTLEMTSESSGQTVTIEGNYDSYARHSKFQTKIAEGHGKKVDAGDKDEFRLPKIVDKSTFGLYSRHGPIVSTGLPKQANQKQGTMMGLYSGPTPAMSSAKGSRYSAYTWKNWS